jgi:pimeloyl-ACP methyl ester carboxylesterase
MNHTTRVFGILTQGLLGGILMFTEVAAAPRNVTLPNYASRPGQMVDVGGYRLNLYCMGRGTPTVVLLSGGGWGAVAWAELQPRIAKMTRVCSYDRAGMNFSDIGPIDGNPGQDLRDLTALLKNANIAFPVVLVGWSAGGMLARGYTNALPDNVAAIVTVDGSDFDYWDSPDESAWLPHALELFRNCQQQAVSGVFETDPKAFKECSGYGNPLTIFPELHRSLEHDLHNPAHYTQWLNELEHESDWAAELRQSRRSYGQKPLVVLVAGDHFRPNPKFEQRPAPADISFVVHSYQILSLSNDSKMIVMPDTSHAIHYDRPDFVTDVIMNTVTKVRDSNNK